MTLEDELSFQEKLKLSAPGFKEKATFGREYIMTHFQEHLSVQETYDPIERIDLNINTMTCAGMDVFNFGEDQETFVNLMALVSATYHEQLINLMDLANENNFIYDIPVLTYEESHKVFNTPKKQERRCGFI